MRAFLMGALLLLSRCLVRTLHMPAALAAAMFLVLLIDPWSAADVGFQLSYFSTAGMILGAASFTQLLVGTCNKCPKWIVIILSATLVAQACVLPLQLYYFGQFTPYCLIANILVSPAVAPLTVLGFADSLLYVSESFVFSPHILSACLAKVCYLPLEVMRRLVAGIASCPLAQINTGQAELAAVLLYYFVLLLFPLLALKARGRLWSLLFAMSFLTLIATIAGPAKEDSYSRNKAAPAQVRSGTGLKKQSRFLQ